MYVLLEFVVVCTCGAGNSRKSHPLLFLFILAPFLDHPAAPLVNLDQVAGLAGLAG